MRCAALCAPLLLILLRLWSPRGGLFAICWQFREGDILKGGTVRIETGRKENEKRHTMTLKFEDKRNNIRKQTMETAVQQQ